MRTKWLPWGLSILSGILIGTSYLPFPPWAGLFQLVPLWYLWLTETKLWRVFVLSWLTQIILSLIGFNWIAHTIVEFGNLPLIVGIALTVLFAMFANLFLPIAGVAFVCLKKYLHFTAIHQLLLMAVLCHLSQLIMPTLFPWNFAYSWIPGLWGLIHWADIVGFWGLSLLVLVFNAAVVGAVVYARHHRQRVVHVLLCGLALAAINVTGKLYGHQYELGSQTLRVLLVQANIGNLDKHRALVGWGFRNDVIQRYFRLTRQGKKDFADQIDFFVWPETAFPDRIGPDLRPSRTHDDLKLFLSQLKIPGSFGSYSYASDQRKVANVLTFTDANGEFAAQPYVKTYLLAFGETLPFGDHLPGWQRYLPMVSDFARGTGPQVKDFMGWKLGPQICYEGLFDSFSKELADQGAELFLNITNDSWFGSWQEPWQHLYMTAGRAIEFRRPLIRSTNTGISTVVLANGKLLDTSPLEKEWAQVMSIPLRKNPEATFFQNYPWLHWGLSLMILFSLVARGIYGRLSES